METSDNKILNNYLGLLQSLSINLKLDLIEKLTQAVKTELVTKPRVKSAFGAWKSEETAEEIISKIQLERHTNRQIEEF